MKILIVAQHIYLSINIERCEIVYRGNSEIEKALFHHYYASVKVTGGSNFMGNIQLESTAETSKNWSCQKSCLVIPQFTFPHYMRWIYFEFLMKERKINLSLSLNEKDLKFAFDYRA